MLGIGDKGEQSVPMATGTSRSMKFLALANFSFSENAVMGSSVAITPFLLMFSISISAGAYYSYLNSIFPLSFLLIMNLGFMSTLSFPVVGIINKKTFGNDNADINPRFIMRRNESGNMEFRYE